MKIKRLGREIADAVKRTQENSLDVLQRQIAEFERAGQGNGSGESVRELAHLRAEVDRLKPAAGAGFAADG